MAIERLAREFESTVWLMHPPKLAEIAEVIAVKMATGKLPEQNEIEAAVARQKSSARRAGNVAVIPVFGTMSQRMGMVDAMSGGMSLEAFAETLRAALADQEVGKIALRFDSPGGSVFGVEETARLIADASRQKPVFSVIDPQAASAAYWLATQASQVIVTPSGQAGSIGAYTVHFDRSQAMEEEGVKVTIIKAGVNKAEGNPYEALTPEALEHLQSLVQGYENAFVNAVAKGRGVSQATVRESFGQGRMFDAKRLVKLGMADRVASFDDVLDEMQTASRSRSVAASVPLLPIAAVSDDERLAAWIEAEAEGPLDIDPYLQRAIAAVLPKPIAAGGLAAPETIPAPTPTAPEAKEQPMSAQDTAAQTTGAGTPSAADAIASERLRAKNIRGVAKVHGMEAKADGWIEAGLTVAAVNEAILKELEAKQASAGQVRTTVQVGKTRAEDDPRRGFESHRDFLLSVMKNRGTTAESVRDERLRPLLMASDDDEANQGTAFILPQAFSPSRILAAAGSDEQGNYSNPYGGFLQPVQVIPGLRSIGADADPTVSLVENLPMAAPIVKINARVDKNHATSVSGGLTFTRTPETAALTASRMALEQITMEAQNLVGGAYATEQVMQDSPISFASLLASGFQDQRGFHILNEKINGVGGAQYVGVLNADCTISVAKETSQAAATINYKNVLKMRARCWGYGQAIWLANYDTLPELSQMSLAVGTGGSAVYVPGTFGASPDTLLGRPIVFTEMCPTVGTVGDIILANWSQYLEGLYQPMRSDESIHVRFLNLERAFRFYERNCGAPWWRSALTPKAGSTLSPFVTLATRA